VSRLGFGAKILAKVSELLQHAIENAASTRFTSAWLLIGGGSASLRPLLHGGAKAVTSRSASLLAAPDTKLR